MVKKLFTISQIKKITGASHRESVHTPFYYAPPFLDKLREQIGSHLSSTGGRPTIEGAEVVRKVRFSEETWQTLKQIAEICSRSGASISPAQVAASILEEVISADKSIGNEAGKTTKKGTKHSKLQKAEY